MTFADRLRPAQGAHDPRPGLARLTPGLRRVPTLAAMLPEWRLVDRRAPADVAAVLAWGRRPSAEVAETFAARHGLPLIRVEDGFLRSVELGSRCPPLSIVIDDLGESMAVAKRLANLPFPVSFSVLPHNSKAREVANLARQKNRELLLHLPSEPEGYPKTANSGPGTLRVNMAPAMLERALVDNLARLPEVDGVNNHMGSRLTQDRAAMTVVLGHLKGQGMFFLDSLTTPKSCVREVSKSVGMRYYRRHIFLDNTAKEHAILLQLKKAESLARRTGLAVAIGHPYPATLSALESWAKSRDMSVVICKIQDI